MISTRTNSALGLSTNHESTVGPCNRTEESIEVDPYIENDVDSAPWIYGEIVASGDEIAHVFDDEVEGTYLNRLSHEENAIKVDNDSSSVYCRDV